MTNVNQFNILQEVVNKLRSADILTTTQRNVTTTSATGTVSGVTINIPVSNIKNVRSVSVDAISKTYGTDYTINFNNSGTCTLTFGSTQTGSYNISYDYGTDKIFSGYPRNDLSISSFPQIAVEFIDISTEPGGFGNVNRNRFDLSIVAYSAKKEDLRAYTQSIRDWIVTNQNNFYYLNLVKPTLVGPIVIGDFNKFKDRIFQQNIDFRSILNYEIN